jgi:serine/threonine-protein kinase
MTASVDQHDLALAEDIELWMADEPVSAWREPLSRRTRRWARRNRTVVTAVAAAVLVALASTAAMLAVQTRANQALQISNAALRIANTRITQANADLLAAKDRETARFHLAMDAIGLFHGEVSEDLLLKEKQFDTLRNKLLRGAAGFYRKLEGLLKSQDDSESQAALGKAYHELGALTAKIGNNAEALSINRDALKVRRELASRPGANDLAILDVARSLVATGCHADRNR